MTCWQRLIVAACALTEPLGDHPFAADFHRHCLMQCEGIGGAIGLQIVPGQCQTWRGGETAPEALEAGLTAAFNGIEVDQHCPSALAPAGSVVIEFLGTGGEPIGVPGMDIAADIKDSIEIKPGKSEIIPTGLAVSIPKNFEIQIRPRSGLAAKNQISVLNTPGTIDADYRGELKVILINLGKNSFVVEKGLRIAQMVLCPIIKANIKEVETLENTKRGSGGFGSTGVK